MFKAYPVNPFSAFPDSYMGLIKSLKEAEECSLSPQFIELVKLRVSIINGCKFCEAMHKEAAVEMGAPTTMIDAVCRQNKVNDEFSEAELIALNWAEEVTKLKTNDYDDLNVELTLRFDDADVAALGMIVAITNSLNRLATVFNYQPAKRA